MSTPIAPAKIDAAGPQESPIPYSHGVAIQYIVDPNNPNPPTPPGPNGDSTCADLSTCEYLYNPGYLSNGVCTIGSLNYQQGVSPSNPNREGKCDPAIGGNPNYCSPFEYWCCSVQKAECTGNAEVLAAYDGSAPAFKLWSVGSVTGGITLIYPPTLNYAADPFQCGGTDPATGTAYTRSLYIRLDCDESVKSGLANIVFAEDPVEICQFNIRARTAAACPTLVVPLNITCNATSAPINATCNSTTPSGGGSPSAASASSPSLAAPAAVGSFFGGAVLSAIVSFALVYLGYTSACPRAAKGSGISNGGGEQPLLIDTAEDGSARFMGPSPPSHATTSGLDAALNDLTTAQFKLLRERGALNIKGELLAPVTLPPGDLDAFSVRQQITLGRLGVLLG